MQTIEYLGRKENIRLEQHGVAMVSRTKETDDYLYRMPHSTIIKKI